MSTISLTRFNKTAGGYNRSDVSELQHGPDCEDTLTGLIRMMMDGSKKQPEAWSFCRFKSGKMCGDTWVDGSAVLLEYHQAKIAEDAEARLQEIIEAANSLFHAFYIISSTTRYNQPTWTLVFPLSEKVNAKRYARIASVLATQLKLGRATSGIQSHTHLIHVNADSWAQYKAGHVINPDFFIKTTAHEAQVFDPTQFERKKPFAAAQIEPPTNTSADPGLFDWGRLNTLLWR